MMGVYAVSDTLHDERGPGCSGHTLSFPRRLRMSCLSGENCSTCGPAELRGDYSKSKLNNSPFILMFNSLLCRCMLQGSARSIYVYGSTNTWRMVLVCGPALHRLLHLWPSMGLLHIFNGNMCSRFLSCTCLLFSLQPTAWMHSLLFSPCWQLQSSAYANIFF